MAGYRSFTATPRDIHREWHVVDATGQTLGRLATQIATLLRGKHKPTYTPHMDTGDFVVVVNAGKFKVSGNRLTDKHYYRHSQYPGGLRAVSMQKMLDTHPTRIIELAVKGMLPDTKLGRAQIKKLKVYAGPTHPHERHISGLVRQKAAAEAKEATE
ncbi:MAG: 50S ribosomal protein L13 [Dehalococcoidia bacterium]